ncbi:unnamed protein product [Fusarium graminearum]|nr:unnamed protein product [Fusarium graminearum]
MEPASLAFGVVAIFKDTYLTAKFITNTLHTIKNHHEEQGRMITQFTVQIYRFKNLSRLFRAADGNKIDVKILNDVPDEYLITMRDILAELQQVLAQYAKLAATLDEDYIKFSPLTSHFKFDQLLDSFEIDDSGASGNVQIKKESLTRGATNLSVPKARWWTFGGLGLSSSKAGSIAKKAKSFKGLLSQQSLPPGVEWIFTKNELEKTLKNFKLWNDNLQHLIAPLLDGFGFYIDKELQERLRSDGEVNIFQDLLIPWDDVALKASEPRIMVEFKRVPTETTTAHEDEGDVINPTQPMKELYGSQLALLLRTAGKHSFQTLPLSSYSRDDNNSQYAYMFEYPSGTSNQKPKSLRDLILSAGDTSGSKLELKQRFHVAQVLARAIGAFHSDGWLHKSIRAHAIKFFFHEESQRCDFENPYLTDFGLSRPVAGVTRLAPHKIDIDHEIYLHPDRQGQPNVSFNKIHDIYSLGIVLLEIGLWQTAKQIYQDIIRFEFKGKVPKVDVAARALRKNYLRDAEERLAHRMGESYQQAVLSCLQGDWDDLIGSRDFANQFQKRIVEKVGIKAFSM